MPAVDDDVDADVAAALRPVRSPEELYREQAPALVGLAALLLGDRARAEEVVQEAFVALLRAGRRGPAPGSERAWLRRVVANRCTGDVRRLVMARRRQPPLRRDAVLAVADDGGIAPDRRAAVLAAVRALPGRQRACTVLRFYDDLTDDEIAATLGISAGSVKTHLSRARSALRAELGGPDDD